MKVTKHLEKAKQTFKKDRPTKAEQNDSLWINCPGCNQMQLKEDLNKNYNICRNEKLKVIKMEKMPVFVKIDEYRDVLDLIEVVRRKVDDAKATLLKIHDLKNEEDSLVEQWQNSLAEVEKKIEFIDHTLNEPEHY